METFLFAWNPNKWHWKHLDNNIKQIEQTGHAIIMWSVISHKKVQPGDRAFLMRLGVEPKGIMGSGFIVSHPFLSKHWGDEDKLVNRVNIEFEVLLNSEIDPLLNLKLLNDGNLSEVNWTPQFSGIIIPSEYVDELEQLWFTFLTTHDVRNNPFKSTDNNDQREYSEGNPTQIMVTKYERNPYAKKVCIDYYGYSCSVCGFNFEMKYGQIGKDYIQVHHLNPLAKVGKESKVDPIHDMRPVCPNCHAMIHKRKEPYTIDQVKEFIKHT